MKPKANRRQLKNYLVANKTHLKMMFANIILMLLVFAVIIVEVIIPFYHEIFKIHDVYAQHYSAKFFVVLLDRLSISLLVILFFNILYQMIVNHKFCGPLINFSHTFKKIARGDLTRKVFLRRNDFHKNEAAQVNDMIDSLSKHIMTIKKDHDLLMATLEDIMAGEMTPTERVNSLNTLKKHADNCHDQLSVFKIKGKDD
jgi:methyl-accepting chemotaxis protein